MATFAVHADYATVLFADLNAAWRYARKLEAWLNDNAPAGPVGPLPDLYPVEFSPSAPDFEYPLEAGPGQERCKRIQRHLRRWHRQREQWWNSL